MCSLIYHYYNNLLEMIWKLVVAYDNAIHGSMILYIIIFSNLLIIGVLYYYNCLVSPSMMTLEKKQIYIKRTTMICAGFSLILSLFLLSTTTLYFKSHYPIARDFMTLVTYNVDCLLLNDNLSNIFISLTTFIILVCVYLIKENSPHLFEFCACLLLINMLLISAFSAFNILLFYICFEAVLIPMFYIIFKWGSRERKVKAVFYFFLYTIFGSFFMLIAIIIIYWQTKTLQLTLLARYDFDETTQKILWVCFLIGFGVKIPIMPFHLWLPEAHVEAPTIGSIILASLLLKLGGYGFLRISITLFPIASQYFSPLVNALALFSVINAGICAFRQMDIKKMIAYTSIAHMNLVVAGIFTMTPIGILGAIYLMVAHGIVSAGLFLSAGILYDRFKTKLLPYYSGLTEIMPNFCTFFTILSFANFGFPGTANFIGEYLIFQGIANENEILLTLLVTAGTVSSVTYSLWLANRLLFGSVSTTFKYEKGISDITLSEFYSLLLLIVLTVLWGMHVDIILPFLLDHILISFPCFGI